MVDRFVERLRKPEYTGQNRCGVCTAVNTILAAALGVAVGTLWVPAGVGVFGVSLALIYTRGYLVPGTPALTKRYFPEWLLTRFHADEPHPGAAVEDVETRDIEGPYEFLDSVDVVEPCPDGGVCLTDEFRARWEDRIDRARSRSPATLLAVALDVDADELTVEDVDGVSVSVDGRRVGRWNSRAVFLADFAAWRELAALGATWEGVPDRDRRRVVGALRIFVEWCPRCGVPVETGTETDESCCTSHTRTRETGYCPECETTFFSETVADGLLFDRERTHSSAVTLTFPLQSVEGD